MKKPRIAEVGRLGRRCVLYGIMAVGVYAAVTTAVEPFHIPSGSMAPSLRGHHRVGVCPCCGHEVVVGRLAGDVSDHTEPRFYRKVFCPNCGHMPVSVADTKPVAGDRIIVNKTAFWTRPPNRWEIVVFRLLGTYFIKRVFGLPGEEVLLHDGDAYVDGKLVRKTLAEARSMRLPVFDSAFAPKKGGWQSRWERTPADPNAKFADNASMPMSLDGQTSAQTLTYRNYSLDAPKCEPLRDEYAYNAGLHADAECVHDFLVELEIEARAGEGVIAIRLCDGHDWAEVIVPVGDPGRIEAFAWPIGAPDAARQLAESDHARALPANKRCCVEAAFVDRRLTLAVDGEPWLTTDLPEAKKRAGVERPFQIHAEGIQAQVHRVRLFRDIHFGQQGNQGVRGKSVLLGANQYFMLGDNSPTSEDSRFWPNLGRIDRDALVGSVLLVNGATVTRR